MPAAEVLQALTVRFSATEFALGATLPAESLLEAARVLRDQHGYRYYIAATATDFDDRVEVIHGLRNLETNDEFFLKVALPKPEGGDAVEVESLALLFSGAEWHEREIYDLFGVDFRSHPDPRRILMPDEYEGHPLRKDFPMDTPWGYRPATSETEGEA